MFSSSGRVHQCLYRGRAWLADNQIPADIEEIDGRFRLRLNGPVSFILSSSAKGIDNNTILLERLRAILSRVEYFSSSEVAQAAEVSQVTAVRFLGWAVENGHMEKFGTGRATRYVLGKSKIQMGA